MSNPHPEPHPENLKRHTSESARIAGRKGAEVANAKKAKKKTFKEILEVYLDLPVVADEEMLDGIDPETKRKMREVGMTYADLINLSVIREAKKGNMRAYEAVRDQLGQKPIEKTEVKIEGDIDLQQADIDDLLKSVKKLKK